VTGELVAPRRVLVTVSGALAPGSAFDLTLNTSAWTTVHASLFSHWILHAPLVMACAGIPRPRSAPARRSGLRVDLNELGTQLFLALREELARVRPIAGPAPAP
jgi:hypothetical protein